MSLEAILHDASGLPTLYESASALLCLYRFEMPSAIDKDRPTAHREKMFRSWFGSGLGSAAELLKTNLIS